MAWVPTSPRCKYRNHLYWGDIETPTACVSYTTALHNRISARHLNCTFCAGVICYMHVYGATLHCMIYPSGWIVEQGGWPQHRYCHLGFSNTGDLPLFSCRCSYADTSCTRVSQHSPVDQRESRMPQIDQIPKMFRKARHTGCAPIR